MLDGCTCWVSSGVSYTACAGLNWDCVHGRLWIVCKWWGLAGGARRLGRSNEGGWGEIGCQDGCAGYIRPCWALGGCWGLTLWLESQKSGGMSARFGGLRPKLMWESDGRGAFGACVAARRARSVAIEGGGCIGPRRVAHKIPFALRTILVARCNQAYFLTSSTHTPTRDTYKRVTCL